MEIKWTLNANWWLEADRSAPIPDEHREELEEHALKRISDMMDDGYLAGELNADIAPEGNPDGEEIAYRGWWSVEKACDPEG